MFRMLHDESGEEYQYYKQQVQVNTVQTQLLFLFLSKRIGRVNALYNLRYSQYVFLLIYFRHWLVRNGYQFLPRWIMMSFDDESLHRMANAAEFTKNRRYSANCDKYKYVIGSFARNNILSKFIASVYNNIDETCLSYEEDCAYTAFAEQYEGGRDNPEVWAAFLEEQKIVEASTYSQATVTEEVLAFIQTI